MSHQAMFKDPFINSGDEFHVIEWSIMCLNKIRYPLVNYHSNGKWLFIVDFPIENGDFP
jgi:hypothetical protein